MIKVFGGGFISNHLVKRLKDVEVIHHDQPYKIDKADYIFFLQSYGNHYNQTDKIEMNKANVLDLYKLLEHVKNIPYKAFIHFSSSSVTLPVKTFYAETKLIAENICKRYKNTIIIRPYSLYGPGEASFRFIPTVIKHLLDDQVLELSKGSHDWIYIDDFVDAVVHIMDNSDKFIGDITPIGTGNQYTNEEIVNFLEVISKKKLNRKYGEDRPYDTYKWKAPYVFLPPKVSIIEGLTKCWKNKS